MGKKSKSKSKSPTTQIKANPDTDSSDIFKLLFGREAHQQQGLGLTFENKESNVVSGVLEKKKKREKSDLDDAKSTDEDSNKVKKKKEAKLLELVDEVQVKEKRKKEVKSDSEQLDLVVKDEVKKKRKKDKEMKTNDNQVVSFEVVEDGDKKKKKKKKKKRKRDEVEQAYEAKNYSLVDRKDEGNKKAKKVGDKRKSVDDPAELMVTKEGFDDEAKLSKTVFVGNLPMKLKKKSLFKEFSKFGEIESVRIRSVPLIDTKTPRKGAIMKGKINEAVDSVHAYIVFKDEKSAQASLSHNMAMVGENHIRVDKACPPRKKLKADSAPVYDNQRTVFVGNLPFDVKDEELYKLFCGINQLESNIEGVRVIRDPTSSAGKGIAYVLFKTKEAANLVIRKKNLKIRDRDLRLYHAKKDATPSKKRDLPGTSANNSSGKRPAPASHEDDKDKNKKFRTVLSYQGLKASKSTHKKESFRPRTVDQGRQNPSTTTVLAALQKNQSKYKRPAVAARKAKVLKDAAAVKQIGDAVALKQTGVKRKFQSRTPERKFQSRTPERKFQNRTPDSFHRNKKARKF